MSARGNDRSPDDLRAIAGRMRRDIIEMLAAAGSGHPGGSLSVIDILTTLWFREMRHRADDPAWADRDRCILSKGHAVPALYAVLAEAGYIEHGELAGLRKLGSRLQGHPDRRFLPCLEGNTGSLGQGLSLGLGAAVGLKASGSDARIYVVLGDGEIQEGQVWEAALWAGAHPDRVDNVCAILDANKIQNDTFVKNLMPMEPHGEKWAGMGWNVVECDGHDMDALISALDAARACTGRPTVIIADTIKGKGVSFMENEPGYHGVAPNAEEREKALAEIGEPGWETAGV